MRIAFRGVFIAVAFLLDIAGSVGAAENRLVQETIIEASVDDVWEAFTTSKGLASWMAPHVEMDLKIGGKMRSNYNPQGKIGDPATIENTVLNFDPKRMFSYRCTKTPSGFPFPKSMENMWSVMYFEPMGANRMKLTYIGLGYTDDEESQKLRDFFHRHNPSVFEKLQKKFAPSK